MSEDKGRDEEVRDARPSPERSYARMNLALAMVIFALTLVLLMATDSQYGITYDEPIYQSKSLVALEWLKLFVTSPSLAASPAGIARYWQAKDQHPGFPKLVNALSAVTLGKLLPADAALRTGTNLLCAVCFAVLYLFVAGIWGRAAGLYAVGALLLMPRVFAHCHLAALDAPVMAMTFLTLVASWRACLPGLASPSGEPSGDVQVTCRSALQSATKGPTGHQDLAGIPNGRQRALESAPTEGSRSVGNNSASWPWLLLAGALWGLALSTKLNAFFVPLAVFPWALVFARRQALKLAVGFAVLGPLLFLATWPWLWHETWPRFLEYFQFHFRHWEISVMYFGRIHDVAPWHYPLVMTVITTPPVTLLLAVVGFGSRRRRAGCLRWRRARTAVSGLPPLTQPESRAWQLRRAALALVAWALLVNLIPSCLPSTPKYNGVRLFLPIFPLIAVLAAAGFKVVLEWVIQRAASKRQAQVAPSKVAAVWLFLALVTPLAATARFAPFHLSYYSAFIGGLGGAVRAGMEPTYWGDTYRSAALWLAEKAEPGATVWIEPVGFESTVRLFELGPLRPDLRFSSGPEGFDTADYAVTQNKPTEFSDFTRRLVATQEPVFTDGVGEVPLVYVFEVRE